MKGLKKNKNSPRTNGGNSLVDILKTTSCEHTEDLKRRVFLCFFIIPYAPF